MSEIITIKLDCKKDTEIDKAYPKFLEDYPIKDKDEIIKVLLKKILQLTRKEKMLTEKLEMGRILFKEKEDFVETLGKCAIKLVKNLNELTDALNEDAEKHNAEWEKFYQNYK